MVVGRWVSWSSGGGFRGRRGWVSSLSGGRFRRLWGLGFRVVGVWVSSSSGTIRKSMKVNEHH